MRKIIRFSYLIIALLLVVSISSTSFMAFAENEDATTSILTEDDTAAAIDATEKKVEPIFNSLSDFEKIAALGDLELYMLHKDKEWVCFGIRNVKTDSVWYSIPQMLDSITVPVKKKEAKSTGIIYYQNESKETSQLYTSDAMRKGDYSIEKIENGARVTYSFPREELDNGYKLGYKVPMVFRLTADNGFEAGVEFNSLVEDKETETKLTSVAVMPYFGCADYKSDGYTFIPDGSGALISNDYTPLDGVMKRLSLDVYDNDQALNTRYSLGNSSPNVVPVFGAKGDDKGFVAVIEKGAAVASINATPSRASVPYTSVYAEFKYRYQDTFDTTNNWFNKSYNQTAYSYTAIDCCSVVYYPLEGDDADYIGMAKRYRKYLTDVIGVKNSASQNVSFNLDTIGAITKSVSKFGFIVDAVQPVTTYDQAGRMLSDLYANGIDKINMRMTGWTKGGMESSFITNAKPESKLGGKSRLKDLISNAKDINAQLYFDIDVAYAYSGKFTWPIRKFAVHNILNEYSEKGFFSLETGILKQSDNMRYLTNSKYFETQINYFCDDFAKYDQKNISLATLGSTLYSDFQNGKSFTDRQKSADYAAAALALAKEKQGSVMVDKGYAYSYASADKIIGIPMYSSGLETEDTDIPFVQIALHGLIDYTESAHNLSDDPTIQFLRMLETGSMPYYLLTWSESTVFLDTDFNYIYSSNYYTWNETAIKDYKTLSSVLNGYCDKEITDHAVITSDVRATTYDNSMTVVVNYGRDDYNYGGKTVKAGGFIVIKEGE